MRSDARRCRSALTTAPAGSTGTTTTPRARPRPRAPPSPPRRGPRRAGPACGGTAPPARGGELQQVARAVALVAEVAVVEPREADGRLGDALEEVLRDQLVELVR